MDNKIRGSIVDKKGIVIMSVESANGGVDVETYDTIEDERVCITTHLEIEQIKELLLTLEEIVS